MNYKKLYSNLCERGKTRMLNSYTERHHIIPRCLKGNDLQNNLTYLTPEEHYVAHQLLIKIYPNIPKLAFAANMMVTGRKKNNKLYGWIRRKISKAMTEYNPKKGRIAWNSGKKLDKPLRKSPWSEAERKMHSARMKKNNPNADGNTNTKKIEVIHIQSNKKFIFKSLALAERVIAKKYNILINHSSIWNNMKRNSIYKGFKWNYIDKKHN